MLSGWSICHFAAGARVGGRLHALQPVQLVSQSAYVDDPSISGWACYLLCSTPASHTSWPEGRQQKSKHCAFSTLEIQRSMAVGWDIGVDVVSGGMRHTSVGPLRSVSKCPPGGRTFAWHVKRAVRAKCQHPAGGSWPGKPSSCKVHTVAALINSAFLLDENPFPLSPLHLRSGRVHSSSICVVSFS